MEANEWSFCEMWTEKFDLGSARALVNEKLEGDYFFNRASVENYPADAEKVGRIFWERGMDCHLYFHSPPKDLQVIDTMHVLRSTKTAKGGVSKIDRHELPTWIDVFCNAFEVPEWKGEVERIIGRNFEKLELLLSYKDGEPAGCAILYEMKGFTGLYCLGTIRKFRGMGIAQGILAHAQAKTGLFLQTLGSEGFLDLYIKSGFELAYSKKICLLPRPGA